MALTQGTSNAVESLHQHMYLGCGLRKGGAKFQTLEGLRRLFDYCHDFERTYQLALSMHLLYTFLIASWRTTKLRRS